MVLFYHRNFNPDYKVLAEKKNVDIDVDVVYLCDYDFLLN